MEPWLTYIDFRKRPSESRTGSSRLKKREVGRKRSLNSLNIDINDDDSKWIHRDKLAQIESRELEEAGICVDRMNTTRSTSSRSSSKRQSNTRQGTESSRTSGDNQGHVQTDAWQERDVLSQAENRGQEEKWTETGAPGQDTEGNVNSASLFESQKIVEQGSFQQQNHGRHHVSKNSSSRIPISKGSPSLSSHNQPEREVSSQKGRPSSGAWNSAPSSEISSNPKFRRRSQSVGSQILLDQPLERTNSGYSRNFSGPASQSEHKILTNTVRTSSIRKVTPSKITIGSKQQPQSSNSNTREASKRPATSAGRLSSGHPRPEGDPPWLASMYKPDPRLPPDQQMIPTHAKRLAQEQWEKDGKAGMIYDKEFKPLEVDDEKRLSNAEQKMDKPAKEQVNPNMQKELERNEKSKTVTVGQWPLPGQRSEPMMNKAANSSTEHAGYKTIPRIQPPQPSLLTPSPAGTPTYRMSPQPEKTEQIPLSEEEKKEKSKLCGCCIIM